MIAFPAIRSALLALWNGIGTGSGAQFRQLEAVMAHEWRGFIDPRTDAVAIMNIIAVRAIGEDSVRREAITVAGAPKQLPSVEGFRILTVSFRVECTHQDIGASALWFLERMRTRLRLPSVEDALRAAGLALVDVGGSQDLSMEFQGRMRARAAFDAQFACVASETAAEADALDIIESVEIRSDLLTRPDGTATDPQVEVGIAVSNLLMDSGSGFIEDGGGSLIEVT